MNYNIDGATHGEPREGEPRGGEPGGEPGGGEPKEGELGGGEFAMQTGADAGCGQHAYHHGDLPAALVKVALAELETTGYEAIKLSRLARRAGVSQAAPYRHFADRDALLAAVALEGFLMLNAHLRGALATNGRATPAARIAHAYLAFEQAHKGLYRLLFESRVYALSPEDGPLRRAARENLRLLADAFGSTTGDDARERAAVKVWAALHGVAMLDEMGMLTGWPGDLGLADLVDEVVAANERSLKLARAGG